MQRTACLRALVLLLPLALLGACKEGDSNDEDVMVPLSAFGNDGCDGPNQVFGGIAEVYSDLALIGSMSQLAASGVAENLYFTGANASVVALDFSVDPMVPTSRTVVAPGDIDVLLGNLFVSPPPGELSGISVLDPLNLAVLEHVSNTVLIISLVDPQPVGVLVGFPSLVGALGNGPTALARFDFTLGVPTQLVVSGNDTLFITDVGSNVVRIADISAAFVLTYAGNGLPASTNGSFGVAGFDQPSGISLACNGDLLISEIGATGNKLRRLDQGPNDEFTGEPTGETSTITGDGTDATIEGVDTGASLGQPVSPVITANGETYWVDSSTGILRRHDFDTGLSDCPLFADCTAANTAGGSFSGPGNYSLAISLSGNLYVLDGNAGKIFLVTP